MLDINVVIFDADGMVVRRDMRFSDRLSKKYGVEPELIAPFFENVFKKCLVGSADLKEEILPYLERWSWKGDVDSLIKYWFENEKELNSEVLNTLSVIKNSGIKCILTTSNEKYRTDYLFNILGLEQYFDKCFSSSDIGYVKSETIFWKMISESGNLEPKHTFVWDDDTKNLKAAKSAGFNGDLFKGFNSYIIRMRALGLLK